MDHDFSVFSRAVEKRYRQMSTGELHVVDATDLWELYLAAWPEGTNRIFRVRATYDCSCCRSFVRGVGHVVRVNPSGSLETVWDVDVPEPFATVARHLDTIVRQLPVVDVHRTKMPRYSAEATRELRDDGTTHTWNHFYCEVAPKHLSPSPEEARGVIRTAMQVARRGMEELSLSALETVRELAAEGQIYRGEENLPALKRQIEAKRRWENASSEAARTALAWSMAEGARVGTGFRNTAIGTLVEDLTKGVDLERAVKSFETKVAPQNYRRPAAVVSQRMIDDAVRKVRELGLESALERRHARVGDVRASDVLFVERAVQPKLKGAMETALAGVAAPAGKGPDPKSAQPLPVDRFIEEVLPGVDSVDVFVDNQHLRNLVSVTAPVHEDAGDLLKWPGGLAWSYVGDAADSIRERVKRAGGRVDGAALRISLSWSNTDDLDLHVYEPGTGVRAPSKGFFSGNADHVYFGAKQGRYGTLDVDMNAYSGLVRDPVENYAIRSGTKASGTWRVLVHQYHRRESVDVGFELEVADAAGSHSFVHRGRLDDRIQALEVNFARGAITGITVLSDKLEAGTSTREAWGVTSGQYVPVDVAFLSPNHWEGREAGPRHVFFALRGCRTPDPVRGFYGEFLRPDLDAHRRVFEILGSKMKAEPSPEQISGLGFTKGRGDEVTVAVARGGRRSAYRVQF